MEGSNASLERTTGGRRATEDSVELSSTESDGDRTCNLPSVTSKEAQLESAKVEMGEVRKENERLRLQLDKIIKDYQALQKQYQDVARKESDEVPSTSPDFNQVAATVSDSRQELEEENELVSLSLGRTSSIDLKRSKVTQGNESDSLALGFGDFKVFEESKSNAPNENNLSVPGHHENISSSEETTKEELAAASSWPPQKVLKRSREDNEPSSLPSSGKRARVSLRIRCETPTMNDGCQWRKYGQKIAKGNPCPRAYYRCTVAAACPVRKQVQRCAEDMSILIITYEGTHNHPLPISATGIASTTSAAASMLLSGSCSTATNPTTSRPSHSLNGLNFSVTPNKQIFQQHQLSTSSSSSNHNPHHQTITLDLTSSNNTSTSSQNSPHFNLFSRSSMGYPTQYSSRPTSLNFSSSSPANSLAWGDNNHMFSYSSSLQVNTTSTNSNSNQFATAALDQNRFYQSTMQRNNNDLASNRNSTSPPVTESTITAALTSDPSFQSALAAALTTIIGGGLVSSFGSSSTRSSNSTNAHRAGSSSLMLGQTHLPIQPAALPKSTSASPSDNVKEHSS